MTGGTHGSQTTAGPRGTLLDNVFGWMFFYACLRYDHLGLAPEMDASMGCRWMVDSSLSPAGNWSFMHTYIHLTPIAIIPLPAEMGATLGDRLTCFPFDFRFKVHGMSYGRASLMMES